MNAYKITYNYKDLENFLRLTGKITDEIAAGRDVRLVASDETAVRALSQAKELVEAQMARVRRASEKSKENYKKSHPEENMSKNPKDVRNRNYMREYRAKKRAAVGITE